jgi:valyl-tRNA synthetase
MERAIEAVRVLRGWRDAVGVRPGAVIPAVLDAAGYEATAQRVGALARFAFDGAGAGAGTEVASVAVPGGSVAVLESPDVDLGAAERRLDERRATLRAEIARAEQKLSNEGFVAKAPPPVVEAERAKLQRLRDELEAV